MIIRIRDGLHINPAQVASLTWRTNNAVGAVIAAVRVLVITMADGTQHSIGHYPDQEGQDAEAIESTIIEALK